MAPAVPFSQSSHGDALPYGASLGNDAESREIAAEVAAILSKEQQPPPILARAPRPLIVKLPSERYLAEASAKLESLPLEQRAITFQSIVEKYRAMRSAEREKMSRH